MSAEQQAIEQVRKELAAKAEGIIQRYQIESEELKPQLLSLFANVIQPWWQEFLAEEKGSVRRDVFVKGLCPEAQSLVELIPYFYPSHLIPTQILQHSSRKSASPPFQKTAREVLQRADWRTTQVEKEILKVESRWLSERWAAKLFLADPQTRYTAFSGVEVFNWPIEDTQKRTEVYSVLWGTRRRTIHPHDTNLLVHRLSLGPFVLGEVNPRVVVGFASQIKDGTVQRIINTQPQETPQSKNGKSFTK